MQAFGTVTTKWAKILLLSATAVALPASPVLAQEKTPVHAVVDLGHEFTFYGDGRFHKQYLPGQPVATSWGSLFNFDFSNANLLVLLGCEPHLRYEPKDIDTISAFLQEGGGVVLLGTAGAVAQNDLARHFGGSFEKPALKPFRAAHPKITGEIAGRGDTLNLSQTNHWEILITDASGKPLLARRTVGKGTLLVGARGLAGQNPDARDNINASWWQPLLVETAAGKSVNPGRPFHSRGLDQLDHTEVVNGLRLHYSDYLQPYAQAMTEIYLRCRPVIEKRMGVPLSEGMASEIGLLATGGGGFSAGRMLGLAVFWGDFPARQDSMIEFLTHESVHSWVLPFPEIWNEPIATYVGDLAMMDMGHQAEAQRRIQSTISRATRIDPTMKLYDLQGHSPSGAPQLQASEQNAIHWGKSFWILEQLRQEKPDVLARYFQAKRRLATPDKIQRYDANVTVALLSIAMERDLFPWFKEHGFDVDPAKSPIKFPVKTALSADANHG